MKKINKRDSTIILNALGGGVVPSRGLQYIMVGRAPEAQQIMKDLDNIKVGSSVFRLFIGEYGSGKSFIQAFIKQLGFQEHFIVANADLTPERRLYGNDRKAVGTYAELMKNISIKTMPEGNALGTILEKWLHALEQSVHSQESEYTVEQRVEQAIQAILANMMEYTGGFEFAHVLQQYYIGFSTEDSMLMQAALKWLRGEYQTKTDARKDLGVRGIINDDNWYDYLKIWSQFFQKIGYAGFIVNLDEAINLYKITLSKVREKNYETILRIFNDILQGSITGLYFTLSGTPEFLEDDYRGLFSYGALRRRLETNMYETQEYRDMSQPVTTLVPLEENETFMLLRNLVAVHSQHHGYQPDISDQEIQQFITEAYRGLGRREHITVGEIVRKFIGALNILEQHPEYDRATIFGLPMEVEVLEETAQPSPFTTNGETNVTQKKDTAEEHVLEDVADDIKSRFFVNKSE